MSIVVNVAHGYFLPILRRAGIRTAVNVDGIEWHRDKWGRLAKETFRLGAYMTARFADRVIVDSMAIGQYWQRNFHRDSAYISYGAPVLTCVECDDVRALGLEPEGYVLVVARLVPENNIHIALDAIESTNVGVPLVVVGSANYANSLTRRLHLLNRDRGKAIRWLGHVGSQRVLNGLWANCIAYFHGHSVGGTNPSLLQALGAGAPVAAFDTPYNREVLGDDWPYYRTAEELRATLREMLRDSAYRIELRQRGRGIVEERFRWPAVCEEYLQIVESLAERAPAPRGS